MGEIRVTNRLTGGEGSQDPPRRIPKAKADDTAVKRISGPLRDDLDIEDVLEKRVKGVVRGSATFGRMHTEDGKEVKRKKGDKYEKVGESKLFGPRFQKVK